MVGIVLVLFVAFRVLLGILYRGVKSSVDREKGMENFAKSFNGAQFQSREDRSGKQG